MDTDDLIQEAFRAVLGRLDKIEPRRKRAIRAYLQQTIRNRILDEVRRAGKLEVHAQDNVDLEAPQSSPLEMLLADENARRYRDGLARLSDMDRELIVGRIDLDLSYEQLALVTSKPSADAARVAVKRALVRLASEMCTG